MAAVMQRTALALPYRQGKPRSRGLTMVIDNGLPTRYFQDAITSLGAYVDLVKFGWGTALVTQDLADKVAFLRGNDIDFFFGGTFFEKHVAQGRLDDFREFCHRFECRFVEVSNRAIDLSDQEKAGYVHKLAGEFRVLSEVGAKDGERSERLARSAWIECCHQDLDAGAERVILGLAEDLPECGLDHDRLLFEAPTKALQAHLVKRVGSEVNLGNVSFQDILGVETLRLGLRADTLLDSSSTTSPRG